MNQTITPEKQIYTQNGYADKNRWISYSWQINLVKNNIKVSERILEVGVGNKVVSNFLKICGFDITTLDINLNLQPDIIASVDNLSVVRDNQFDNSICFEVLEHLPFSKFIISLKELKRVTKNKIILSLPYWGLTFGLKLRLPLLGSRVLKFKINCFKKHNQNNSAGHHWEIGKKGFSLNKIKKQILVTGLKIEKSFWDLDDPYHYYFILKK